jgi:hypothetical protein
MSIDSGATLRQRKAAEGSMIAYGIVGLGEGIVTLAGDLLVNSCGRLAGR